MTDAATLIEPSFLELAPRERLAGLLDPGYTELLDPFCRIDSPWLQQQGLIAQADDGVVIARGSIAGTPVVAVAIESTFEGGSIGEVGGAKIATALELAAQSCRSGHPTAAVLLLESGGVRLGEANLGLAAIASIQTAILTLRRLAPVVAVIAGPTGCFGGMSLAACLCTHIIGTAHGRLGMNGPEVIEQEAGADELDATDREQIWQMIGCEARLREGFIDTLAHNTTSSIAAAIHAALQTDPQTPQRIASSDARLQRLRQELPPRPNATTPPVPAPSRGQLWMQLLSASTAQAALDTPSVLVATAPLSHLSPETALLLAVVPDAHSPLPRAAHGEMGLEQAWALSACLRAWISDQAAAPTRAPILCLVDTPGQAFGRFEEERCISAACASAIDAYDAARRAGHPVLTLVVGRAISGSFLAHGMQSDYILALDSPGVMMHAMSQESIARITRRTLHEVQTAAAAVAPMSYSITQPHHLGIIDELIPGIDPGHPSPADVATVLAALAAALQRVRAGHVPGAIDANPMRSATNSVHQLMRQQWEALDTRSASPEKEPALHASHQ